MSDIQELTNVDWWLFAVLVLPGFISMQVYGLVHPVTAAPLKDSLLEAIAFGVLNAAVFAWAVSWFVTLENAWVQYLLVLLALVVAPAAWPFLALFIMRRAARMGWILGPYRTSWDAYFSRREPCWIVVHLKDGRQIGGYFGRRSYASLHPNPGHLYIEEVWSIDPATGAFTAATPRSKGLILRPDDYHFVEFLQ